MKKILLIISLLLSLGASSQTMRCLFFSGGFSFLTDGYISNSNLQEVENTTGGSAITHETFQYYQWNFISGKLSARIVVIPITINSSISISATPTLSVAAIYPVHSLGSRYGLAASVPVFAELNIGVAARAMSKKYWGIVLGAGFEYNISPLCSYDITDSGYDNGDFQQSWIMPACKLGFRYYSKKNKVNEINLELGFGEKGKEFYTFDSKLSKEYKPMHIGLSFLKILNY